MSKRKMIYHPGLFSVRRKQLLWTDSQFQTIKKVELKLGKGDCYSQMIRLYPSVPAKVPLNHKWSVCDLTSCFYDLSLRRQRKKHSVFQVTENDDLFVESAAKVNIENSQKLSKILHRNP